jgi:hypothetical protein
LKTDLSIFVDSTVLVQLEREHEVAAEFEPSFLVTLRE